MNISSSLNSFFAIFTKAKIAPTWFLVAERKSCKGRFGGVVKTSTTGECARKCNGVSSMFIVGINDFGGYGCMNGQCDCYCAKSATIDGTCEMLNHNSYRLYKFNSNGKIVLTIV